MFLKAHTALSLKDESIDFVNCTSSLMPPHCMNVDLCGIKSTTILLMAPRAATWKIKQKGLPYQTSRKFMRPHLFNYN